MTLALTPIRVPVMPTTATTVRTFDPNQALAQIGRMNVLAVSGGRIIVDTIGIILPVRYGYSVEVYLTDADLYEVRRVHTRSGVRNVKALRTDVDAAELGDTVYLASCWREEF